MKTCTQFFLLSVLLGLFSTSAVADGVPPSQEDVCDHLQLPGSTPGLFGLCNAYCEARDCDSYPEGEAPNSCSKLLSNYERKAAAHELPMPCLEEPSPVCPCWAPTADRDRFGEAGLNLPATECVVDVEAPPPFFDLASYCQDESCGAPGDEISFFASTADGQCTYINTMTLEDDTQDVTPEELAVCIANVRTLQDNDFGDVTCFDF